MEQTDGHDYKAISISAFGEQFKVEGPQLSAKLRGLALNTLSITHEAGYEQLGGHTVHFKMKRDHFQQTKRRVEEIVISVSKGKGLEIH